MAKKTKKFKTEVQQLLDLVIHSLYSKKEIFLRELISNSSDAIDRAKFESITNADLQREDSEWKIKLITNTEDRTLTITDNGIGMNAKEVEENIGTIANSGTRKFLEKLKESQATNNPELIGQFGVGFYASFMVADKVTVITKRAGEEGPAVKWTSKGAGSYTMEEVEKAEHGTEITLHIAEDMDEYLQEYKLRSIVKSYSDYIAFPIVMDITRTEKDEETEDEKEVVTEETLNSMKAIWKRDKKEITEEEYNDFYKHISHDFTAPAKTIHYSAEGTTEFKALIFIPAQAPMDLYMREDSKSLQLYVKNVFISEDCQELVPEYLRFIKGVVDSSDLPLNVSREMLQDDAIVRRMRKSVVGKVLGALASMKEKTPDEYQKFYDVFGKVLKEGLHSDYENKEKLSKLVLFPSTDSNDKPTDMQAYVDRMPESQSDIYFLTGDNLEAVRNSPHLEAFKSKGYEVLFLTDPIDEWVTQSFTEFDGKKLVAIDRGDLDLDSEEEKKDKEESREESAKQFKDLTEYIKTRFDEDLQEVRLSNRLTDSACCLVSDEHAMTANMERLMKAMNQDVPKMKRILELNAEHAVLGKMNDLLAADKEDEKLADYADILLDQALLTEGSAIKNPTRFAQLVSGLMV